MEDHSLAYEILKTLKVSVKIISIIAIIELIIIGYMGYLLYDSQFEYSIEETKQVDNTSVENSSITQY